jgi:DNA-binding transcriptional MerR regulator
VSKSENAFRTITEVSEILELPAHVLRFWESKFKYIKPMKRGGGRRYYRPEDINLLLGIKHLLYSEGLTIKGAQKIIQTNGVKATAIIGSKIISHETTTELKIDDNDFKSNSSQNPLNGRLKTKLAFKNINSKELSGVLSQLKKVRDSIKIRVTKRQLHKY